MPVSCCSMTCVTEFCTVSAEAPGNVAPILTAGGAMLGYCSIGNVVIESAPAIIMTIAITHAKTGRSMKKREIDTSASCRPLLCGKCRRDRPDRNARAEVLRALHNQPVAVLQAGCHQPIIGDRAGDLERAQLRLVALSGDPRRGPTACVADYALLRRQDGVRHH